MIDKLLIGWLVVGFGLFALYILTYGGFWMMVIYSCIAIPCIVIGIDSILND